MRVNIAWAAGLLVGEGCIGLVKHRTSSGVYEYLSLQIGMYDERAIKRFASTFGIRHTKLFLKTRQRNFFKVHMRGRTAERAIALMWPYLEGTDKADQALRFAKQLGVDDWITGRVIALRPQLQLIKRGRKTCA